MGRLTADFPYFQRQNLKGKHSPAESVPYTLHALSVHAGKMHAQQARRMATGFDWCKRRYPGKIIGWGFPCFTPAVDSGYFSLCFKNTL